MYIENENWLVPLQEHEKNWKIFLRMGNNIDCKSQQILTSQIKNLSYQYQKLLNSKRTVTYFPLGCAWQHVIIIFMLINISLIIILKTLSSLCVHNVWF